MREFDFVEDISRQLPIRVLARNGCQKIEALGQEFDPATRAMNYINAGHNHPMVRRNTGAIERLDRGGLPIGIQLIGRLYEDETLLAAARWVCRQLAIL